MIPELTSSAGYAGRTNIVMTVSSRRFAATQPLAEGLVRLGAVCAGMSSGRWRRGMGGWRTLPSLADSDSDRFASLEHTYLFCPSIPFVWLGAVTDTLCSFL